MNLFSFCCPPKYYILKHYNKYSQSQKGWEVFIWTLQYGQNAGFREMGMGTRPWEAVMADRLALGLKDRQGLDILRRVGGRSIGARDIHLEAPSELDSGRKNLDLRDKPASQT